MVAAMEEVVVVAAAAVAETMAEAMVEATTTTVALVMIGGMSKRSGSAQGTHQQNISRLAMETKKDAHSHTKTIQLIEHRTQKLRPLQISTLTQANEK